MPMPISEPNKDIWVCQCQYLSNSNWVSQQLPCRSLQRPGRTLNLSLPPRRRWRASPATGHLHLARISSGAGATQLRRCGAWWGSWRDAAGVHGGGGREPSARAAAVLGGCWCARREVELVRAWPGALQGWLARKVQQEAGRGRRAAAIHGRSRRDAQEASQRSSAAARRAGAVARFSRRCMVHGA
ncbi:hypothetical protein D1007_27490 [Hordeum vulgare]|nr:hypothetical protein D1007_27490 [Hordeum vulgare]